MIKQMRLRCRIRQTALDQYHCTSKVFDGLPFSFAANSIQVMLDEEITTEKPEVDGYAIVQQESQLHEAAYITLPQPSITHGRHLTVRALQLIPMPS